MLRVVGCITQSHDLGLVALACLVCVLATNTSVRLLCPPLGEPPRHSALRTGAAILAFSTGVWTTHFISMLAYRPGVPVNFDVTLCIASLIVSIIATAIAFTIHMAKRGTFAATVISGLVLATGIGAMHFIGMRSLLVPGVIHYDPDLVAASLGLGALVTVAAMGLVGRRSVGWATMVLTLAVALTHFIAMGSVRLQVMGGIEVTPLGIPMRELVMATGGACLLILSLTLTASVLDQYFTSRLAIEARRFRALADATFEGLIFERGGQIVAANRAMCELAETDAASLVGCPLSDLIPGIERRQAEHGMPAEYEIRLPDGRIIPVEVLWRSDPDDGGRVVAVRDISREKAAEGQIEQMVWFDPLTGLANRSLVEQQLNQAIAMSDRTTIGLGILYVDLDRFEIISETVGHSAAEQILIQTAHRLSGTVRQTDTVARVGRDQFVIIQSLTDKPADAAAMADRIMEEMKLPFIVDDGPVAITASVGIALYPADGHLASDLIKNAVLAVRQAKNDGRARWRYYEAGMDQMLRTKRSLEHDLRRAMEGNQFSLNYQPFFETETLELVGYEALLRWDQPERGRVSPADFIPLAEESGLIVPIGSWVLATACAEAMTWDQPLIISVNLSPAQFLQPGIVTTVADVLHQTGLPPNRLELEITEGVLMENTEGAIRALTELRDIGVRLVLDDFGTGYSSLSYLQLFPFDKLKVDRSFVQRMEADEGSRAIVSAIIAMCRSLNLQVTAEGVETIEQFDLLCARGCHELQGFLLGHPIPQKNVEHFIRRYLLAQVGPPVPPRAALQRFLRQRPIDA